MKHKKLSALLIVGLLLFGATLAHADVKTFSTSIKLTISSIPSSPYDEAYTLSIPESLTVNNTGWNEIGNIVIAHDTANTTTTFNPAKKVVITASSQNSFTLKSDTNSISYTLKTSETDASATTVFEFTAEQINAGASQAIGINVEDYSLMPAGEYEDTITYTASVESVAWPGSYSVGDKVTFGMYSNHELSWTVMSISDSQALLLCDNAVERKVWDSNTNTIWRSSELYSWLNGTFKSSFEVSDARTNKISEVTLLSESEMSSLPFTNTTRACNMLGGVDSVAWWLCTVVTESSSAGYVSTNGKVNGIVNDNGKLVSESAAVRPALWLSLQ